MRKIGEYIKWYFYITTSILFIVAVIFSLYGAETLPGKTLWQIMLSGFATTVVTVAIVFIDCKSSVRVFWKYCCHYILLSAVMILLGVWFGWIALNLRGIALMLASVAGVYMLTFGAYYVIDLRVAKKINDRLKEKYDENNPS